MSDPPTTTSEADAPESRRRLLPGLAEYVERLARTPDRIAEAHRAAGEVLVGWIIEHIRHGQALYIIVVCTGNSRRSILGATMGSIAAAHCGLPEIRFHSGGTSPTAFNPRTVASLRHLGVEVEPTGEEAPRGEPEVANPIYRVRWGPAGRSPMEAVEFSKRYDDPANPQSGFAALMVCDEADAGCLAVRGAALRLSLPYADPKAYDDTPEEAARYDERRDDLGRLMVWVLEQVRRRLG